MLRSKGREVRKNRSEESLKGKERFESEIRTRGGGYEREEDWEVIDVGSGREEVVA